MNIKRYASTSQRFSFGANQEKKIHQTAKIKKKLSEHAKMFFKGKL